MRNAYSHTVQCCNSAKLRPRCVVQPRSTSKVAIAVKALVDADQAFAIRAGDHMNWAGSNNINNGATIDLGLLKETTYDVAAGTADTSLGAKWKDVYEELEKDGRVVAGGREAEVGAGGFLLDGGNTFYGLGHDFACDNIVAYEVHNAGEHQDLFQVLKGEGNNFWVVTKITLKTLLSGPIWDGFAALPAAAEAVADFTARASGDRDSTLNLTVCHIPRLGGAAVVCAARRYSQVLTYTSLSTDHYNVWYTLCFKNDVSIISKATELYRVLAKQAEEKVTDGDFTAYLSLQPIPRLYSQHSVAAGGNMFGLENYTHDATFIQASIRVWTSELTEWAGPVVRETVDGIHEYAAAVIDGICPFLYLNYANPEQKVLESYGGNSLDKMRNVSSKYDPTGAFQRLCPGGFKLANVKS
ncbi:hypothetical protein F5B22DRAFT_638862 [Xylaria bambusicola]|uniref:uncharacterized protein n=1 Tax=Xylaria bambusicola TaxID=326684 RepID=UPI0020071FA2|nr:uncharacterized protein F5B22DRAFT_638862 [Xylaria bambusicola]KAI0506883.1 hypothetical protein F5B22DRAFT_638862 [Xylaria bambusicola]